MKRLWFLIVVLTGGSGLLLAQPSLSPQPVAGAPAPGKKYPSLLWKITGNGLKKPSWLFGTMHVSDKLAFHLGDSFYNAIRSAEVVALETNPESWQDDYSKSVLFNPSRAGERNPFQPRRYNSDLPDDQMHISSFAIDAYDELIKAALSMEPAMVNGMLYRTYADQGDFEEDTFLDMYIFQVGRKLGKRVGGVENFAESEKLLTEAYRDMMREQRTRRKSYSEGISNPKLIEDAYRKGDLDQLDSLEALNMLSESFQEKFLYRRNEIQAASIDSIIRRSSLFVGVGAAHLPGSRGVIELLRRMGYTVTPVVMDDRNSLQKESIDRLRVDHSFHLQTAEDGLYKVAIPGKKFYHFTNWGGMDVVQYADMVNGAYYLVTRIKTNSSNWGHTGKMLADKIDQWLYEYIPGKIRQKTAIVRNGYPGFNIVSRTRRGDYQQYQLFITPFEVIVFKMSGLGDYVRLSQDATRFFGSIRLQEYASPGWISWQPASGGFSLQLPHAPAFLQDNSPGKERFEFAAIDQKEGGSFLVMKMNLHYFEGIEEDSFELNLMEESYASSAFIDRPLSRRFLSVKGLPALETVYKHKDSTYSRVRFIIRGPAYYALVANYSRDYPGVNRFFDSFTIIPYRYPAATLQSDTSLAFTVNSALRLPEAGPAPLPVPGMDLFIDIADDNERDPGYTFRSVTAGNDTTGEKIFITHATLPKYMYEKDSVSWWKNLYNRDWDADSSFIVRSRTGALLPNGFRMQEVQVSDTGSSKLMRTRMLYKGGHLYTLSTLSDTVSGYSSFVDGFFDSFRPADTLTFTAPFSSRTAAFIHDLFSGDTLVARQAVKGLRQAVFDSADAPLLIPVIDSLRWGVLNYLAVKQQLIQALGMLNHPAVLPYLKQLYWKAGDTTDLQEAILNALLLQRTAPAFRAYKDILLQDPPIVDDEEEPMFMLPVRAARIRYGSDNLYDRRPWSRLYDSLSLTKTIFPGILELSNLDDYRANVLDLLVTMVDSGYLKASDYETYFSKLYLEGKLLLKKRRSREERDMIKRAGRKDMATLYPVYSAMDDEEEELEEGNNMLDQYAVLLLPFREKNPGVQQFFTQLMKSRDKRLLYNSMLLLLRNGAEVPDSLLQQFAKSDSYRAELYGDLEQLQLLQRFPAAWRSQTEIARSLLVGEDRDKPDSLVFLDQLPVHYGGRQGLVCFFKYKHKRDDDTWYIASVGMQPANTDSADVGNDEFTMRNNRKLEKDKPVKEQLQQALKEMVITKHGIAENFYVSRYYGQYRGYLPEMVKSRRFRD